jgi:phage N-6-adenine-methyltransferase
MSDLWSTPQALFDKLHAEFNFELDVCALPENKKCPVFFSPAQDGLSQEWETSNQWERSIWMNPPYGREIEKWMAKAYDTSRMGYTVVCLIPNRSNAPWWHDYVMKAHEIRFVKHKVAFDVPQTVEYEKQDPGVPFWGSVIVVFRGSILPDFIECKVSTYMQPRHEVSL